MSRNLLVSLIFLAVLGILGVTMFFIFGIADQDQTERERGGLFTSLFPFLSTPAPQGSDNGPQGGAGNDGPVPELRLVSEGPVAGATFTTGGKLRFVERETGHVYETSPDNLEIIRLTNTTIPGIQEVVWVNDSRVILRYLDGETIESFSGFIASSTPDQSLSGVFLPNATRILALPEEKILSLVSHSSGSRLDILDADGSAPRTIFASEIRSWVPSLGGVHIFLTSAPTSFAPGYLYELTGTALERVLGGNAGFMTLPSPDGRYIAYSTSAEDRGSFGVYDRETKERAPFPVATLAPKCAWLSADPLALFCGVPSGTGEWLLPDEWLMGLTEFSDSAWVFYPKERVVEIVASVSEDARLPIDITNPMVSPDGRYVMFTNKNDSSLWSLKLPENL